MSDSPLSMPPQARLARLGRLARKELSETLRDRRTILTLVLMPLLLYPLLGMVLRLFLPSKLEVETAPQYRLGVHSEKEAGIVSRFLSVGQTVLVTQGVFQPPKGFSGPLPQPPSPSAVPLPVLQVLLTEDLEAEVQRGNLDVGVRLPPPGRLHQDLDRNVAIAGDLLYLEDSTAGRDAVRHIQRLYDAASLQSLREGLKMLPVIVQGVAVPPISGPRPSAFLVLMPLILILMTITGAVYPAIDLTAGERERGTLEILMAAPVPRLSLLLAKYIAVVTVAMLTALVNLGSMALTLWLSGLGTRLFGMESFSPLLLVEVFLLLLLFATFFAALLLALTSFARSFKEAQAYLIPLMLLALVPGVLSLVPGLHLSGFVLVLPLLNIVLLARDLLLGTADPLAAVCVILSTVVFAIAAVALAAAIFGAEAVGSSQGWFRRRRKPEPT
jgi:ABC-2 type transport system permease protein/sodium transport system permease protein